MGAGFQPAPGTKYCKKARVNITGYLIHQHRFEGQRGLHYNYIMAGNGLFIQAENPLLQATVCIAAAKVRGLAPLVEDLRLTHGKIPGQLLGEAIRLMMLSMFRELYVGVVWEDGMAATRSGC